MDRTPSPGSPVRLSSSLQSRETSHYRPTLSQKSKRHVVAITDSMKQSANASSVVSVVVAPPSATASRGGGHEGSSAEQNGTLTLPPRSETWSGGVIAATSAHLSETFNDECVSEVPHEVASPLKERHTPFLGSSIFELRHAAPLHNGFDRLDHSIVRLVHRLPESTLQDKFELISKWIDSYHVDVVPRKLAAQLALLLGLSDPADASDGRDDPLNATDGVGAGREMETTAFAVSPTRIGCRGPSSSHAAVAAGLTASPVTVKRILSSAFALHQLMQVLTKMKPILGPVVMRTLEGVYSAIFVEGNPAKTMPAALVDVTASKESLQAVMRHFQLRTFFQEARDNVRRIAAVQEFVAQFEKVRARQMSSVARHINDRSNMWVNVCFKMWRGAVRRGKEDRATSKAYASTVAERDRNAARASALEETVAAREQTIADLREKMKQQAERADVAYAALKYDYLMAEGRIQAGEVALAAANAKIAELQQQCHELREQIRAKQVALDTQLQQLDSSLWKAEQWSRAREAWQRINAEAETGSSAAAAAGTELLSAGLQPLPSSSSNAALPAAVTVENAQRWIRHLSADIVQAHRNEWDHVETLPATRSFCAQLLTEREASSATASAPFVGHQAIHLIGLALLRLCGGRGVGQLPGLTWSRVVQELLEVPHLATKSQRLAQWFQECQLALGPVLHDYLLLEENPMALHAVAVRMAHLCLAPLSRFSSAVREAVLESSVRPVSVPLTPFTGDDATPCESEPRTLTFSPLQPLLDQLRDVSRLATTVDRFDHLLVAQIAPKLNWVPIDAATRALTTMETADRAPFMVSAKDLAAVPTLPQDEVTVQALQTVLRVHFIFLRQAFLVYAGFDKDASAVSVTLSDFGLTKMMREARVGLPGTVDVPVIKALAGDGLSARRFVVALLQIALLRYSDRSLPDALSALLHRMRVTLFTQQIDALLWPHLRERTFNGMLDDLRPDLMKVFRRYAVDQAANSRIVNAEVAKMIQELKMSDDLLSPSDVQECFALAGPVGGSLSFDQFCNFLCFVGALRVRTPWIPVTSRVSKFLYDSVITPLQKRLQLQSLSL